MQKVDGDPEQSLGQSCEDRGDPNTCGDRCPRHGKVQSVLQKCQQTTQAKRTSQWVAMTLAFTTSLNDQTSAVSQPKPGSWCSKQSSACTWEPPAGQPPSTRKRPPAPSPTLSSPPQQRRPRFTGSSSRSQGPTVARVILPHTEVQDLQAKI